MSAWMVREMVDHFARQWLGGGGVMGSVIIFGGGGGVIGIPRITDARTTYCTMLLLPKTHSTGPPSDGSLRACFYTRTNEP